VWRSSCAFIEISYRKLLIDVQFLGTEVAFAAMISQSSLARILGNLEPTRYSVHVNGPWCVTFEFEDGDACRIDFEQYH